MKQVIAFLMVAVLLGTVLTGTIAAQSNQRVDELLGQRPARNGHAAYLVLTAAGIAGEDESPAAVFRTAQQQGLFEPGDTADGAISFGRYSYLLMESFGERGGVMYRLIPGPRYAAREVVYQRWSRTRRAPGTLIDGEVATRVLSVYLNATAQLRGTR